MSQLADRPVAPDAGRPTPRLTELEAASSFVPRHIGPSAAEQAQML